MNKITAFLLVLATVFTLCACGTHSPVSTPTPAPTPAIRSSAQAITTVKGTKGAHNYTSQIISSVLGFKQLNPGLQTGYELCYIVPTLQKGVDRQWRADTSLVEERHGMASEN